MKNRLFFPLIILFSLFSCTVADFDIVLEQKPEKIVVKAVISDQTKTSMGDGDEQSRKVIWSEEDRIILTYGYKKAIFKADKGGSAYTTFTQESDNVTLDFTKGIMAGYPSDAFSGSLEPDEQIELEIPSLQRYKADSFSDNVMPMLSDVAYEPEFRFRNVAGVLRFLISTELEGLAVKKITLTADKPLSGGCGYLPSEDKYVFDEYSAGNTSVVLKAEEGVQIGSTQIPFNIVVPHQKYESLSITVSFTDGTEQVFVMNDGLVLDVRRSHIANIPLKITGTKQSVYPQVSLECISVNFDSFRIRMQVSNTDSYFCGLIAASNYNIEDVMWAVKYQPPYTNLSYTGSVNRFQTEFNEFTIVPGETYILWIVPTNSMGIYDESDIVTLEVTTPAYTPGSAVSVKGIQDIKVTTTTIAFSMNVSGHDKIYCQLVRADNIAEYTEQQKIDMLLLPGNASAKYEDDSDLTYYAQDLKPDTDYLFLALSIDESGKYGKLFEQKITTQQLDYNDLVVSINKSRSSLPSVNWSVSGGTAKEYVYILTESDSYLWTNKMESSVRTAQETIFLNPLLYYMTKTTSNSVELSLVKGNEYVFVLVAMDAEGKGSIADSWIFTY